jgi:hypothetical protein
MHELMLSTLKIRFSRALSLPSLAGTGLPERMRTTAFAFLGLTAAAGLALVAIFAQVSFHVLTPAPLPNEPVEGSAVAEAVALDHGPAPFVSPARSGVRGAGVGGAGAVGAGGSEGSGSAQGEAPVAPATSGAGAVTQPTGSTTPNPTHVAGDANSSPAPAPEAAPVSNPAPGSSPKPAPTPARPASPTPASPTPAAPPAPGNSSSGAAAAHASDRGIEASSKSSAPVESPPPATASNTTPSPPASPGNGNGKALGHSK